MKPIHFEEVNKTFTAPPGMEDSVLPLPVWQGKDTEGNPQIISCWELSKEEIIEVANTGRVYLGIMSNGMPPVCVMAHNPIVNKSERDHEAKGD